MDILFYPSACDSSNIWSNDTAYGSYEYDGLHPVGTLSTDLRTQLPFFFNSLKIIIIYLQLCTVKIFHRKLCLIIYLKPSKKVAVLTKKYHGPLFFYFEKGNAAFKLLYTVQIFFLNY